MAVDELTEAWSALPSPGPSDRDRVTREAQLAYLRNEERYRNVVGHAALVRMWTRLLAEAAEKIARDDADAEVYASVERRPSDDEWAYAAALSAAETWDDD